MGAPPLSEATGLFELLEIEQLGTGLPAEAALEAAWRTARALQDAWAGIGSEAGRPLRRVHRDIKPGNILLTTHGQVKVVDFELARGAIAERETSTVSTLVGTVGYIAPERFGKREEGPEVDVYSLGVTLLAVISAEAPTLPLEQGMYDERLRVEAAALRPTPEVAATARAFVDHTDDRVAHVVLSLEASRARGNPPIARWPVSADAGARSSVTCYKVVVNRSRRSVAFWASRR